MTASRPVVLSCDYQGCTASFSSSSGRIWATRREAADSGWAYVGKSAGLDLCAAHSTPVNGMYLLGRHTISAVRG